jgi:hypothetical protein
MARLKMIAQDQIDLDNLKDANLATVNDHDRNRGYQLFAMVSDAQPGANPEPGAPAAQTQVRTPTFLDIRAWVGWKLSNNVYWHSGRQDPVSVSVFCTRPNLTHQ